MDTDSCALFVFMSVLGEFGGLKLCNMKKSFLICLGFLCLCSCNPSIYYQVCTVSSTLDKNSSGAYVFQNSDCQVSYDFWSDGGDSGFIFTNNTDSIVYVNLANSFYIMNGLAYDYFHRRRISSASGSSLSVSGSTMGTVHGYWNNWNFLNPKIRGSVSNSLSKETVVSSSQSITFVEKPVVAIPPHSSKIIAEYPIMSLPYRECEFSEYPSKNKPYELTFNIEDSPVKFSNYISYSIGNSAEEKVIENDFYVENIKNIHYDDAVGKVVTGCEGDLYREKVSMFKIKSPVKFYVPYEPVEKKKGL